MNMELEQGELNETAVSGHQGQRAIETQMFTTALSGCSPPDASVGTGEVCVHNSYASRGPF